MAGSMVTVTGIDGPNGLETLIAELTEEARRAPAEVRKVTAKGALNVKKDWQRRWSGIAHAPTIPYTITYDSHETATGGWAEIGPDKSKQVGGGPHRTPGNLGTLLEYGSANNAPIPGGLPALQAEQPRFERALEALPFSRDHSWR